jgi:tetratricopeptide (TPR) repeat protein
MRKTYIILGALIAACATAFASCSTAPRAQKSSSAVAEEAQLKRNLVAAIAEFNALTKEGKIDHSDSVTEAAGYLADFYIAHGQYDLAYRTYMDAEAYERDAGIFGGERSMCQYAAMELSYDGSYRDMAVLKNLVYSDLLPWAVRKSILDDFYEMMINEAGGKVFHFAEAEPLGKPEDAAVKQVPPFEDGLMTNYEDAVARYSKADKDDKRKLIGDVAVAAMNLADYHAKMQKYDTAFLALLDAEKYEKEAGVAGTDASVIPREKSRVIDDSLRRDGEILMSILRNENVPWSEKERIFDALRNAFACEGGPKITQGANPIYVNEAEKAALKNKFEDAVTAFDAAPDDKKLDADHAVQDPASALARHYCDIRRYDLAYLLHVRLLDIEGKAGMGGEESVASFELGRLYFIGVYEDGEELLTLLRNPDIPRDEKEARINGLFETIKKEYSKDAEAAEPSADGGHPSGTSARP